MSASLLWGGRLVEFAPSSVQLGADYKLREMTCSEAEARRRCARSRNTIGPAEESQQHCQIEIHAPLTRAKWEIKSVPERAQWPNERERERERRQALIIKNFYRAPTYLCERCRCTFAWECAPTTLSSTRDKLTSTAVPAQNAPKVDDLRVLYNFFMENVAVNVSWSLFWSFIINILGKCALGFGYKLLEQFLTA